MKLSARNQIKGKVIEIKKGITTTLLIMAPDVLIERWVDWLAGASVLMPQRRT